MKQIAILTILFLTGCASFAQNQTPQPKPFQSTPTLISTQVPSNPGGSLPRPSPALESNSIQRDVTYCTMDGVTLKMDLYSPQQANMPAPAAVFVHGGGWRSGDKSSGNLIPFNDLAAQGFLVAAVNYRLAPRYKFPAMIQDVKCAVRFLRANAASLNIDPNRIGAWGGSAGGHLVALLGTTDASAGFDVGEYVEQSSRVQAVVDMYGPTDLAELFPNANAGIAQTVFGTGLNPLEGAKLASPVTYVTKDDPPFLILQGDKDKVVPPEQSQILSDRLKGAGVPVTLVMVKNAGHGFAPTSGAISPPRAELIKMIGEFFVESLK